MLSVASRLTMLKKSLKNAYSNLPTSVTCWLIEKIVDFSRMRFYSYNCGVFNVCHNSSTNLIEHWRLKDLLCDAIFVWGHRPKTKLVHLYINKIGWKSPKHSVQIISPFRGRRWDVMRWFMPILTQPNSFPNPKRTHF